ncbi:hypothetical protein V5O48_013033 [Marasmius crinis-equi]|uniref:Uncharacterized protein n=1 Tax=Marasmius crinis-equi TaxID=585013 RepID=A0ABR3F1H9_9AGAR
MIVSKTGKLQLKGVDYGTMGNFFYQMAQLDMFTNQTTYKTLLSDFFPQAMQFYSGFMEGQYCSLSRIYLSAISAAHVYTLLGQMNLGLAHSIAAVEAYAAYKDPSFLEWAIIAWGGGESNTLTEDSLRNGRISRNNITIKPTCSNLPMSGGTFGSNDSGSAYVNALATGSFMIASSVLAEATQNQTYLNYARNSKDFYVNHLRNSLGDMLDGVSGDDCEPSDATSSPNNAGLVMEGLAVLMSVLKSDDVDRNLLEVVNKTVSNTEWHSSDGILQGENNLHR